MLTVVIVATLVYGNAVANGFVLDDKGIILHNPLVTGGRGLYLAFAHPYWPESVGGGQYRPLGVASFTLDWMLSGGDPRWFHAMNLLWHAAASLLVFLLAAELLSPAGALGAALLFALHPVHVEAVANVVGRLELMAACGVVGAVLLHRRGSWAAPVVFALALLCKENAIVFVGLALLSDRLLAANWRTVLRAQKRLYAAYAGVAVVYALVLAAVFRGGQMHQTVPALVGVSAGTRWLTVLSVVPDELRLLLAPISLSADYQPRVIEIADGLSLSVGLGVILLICLFAGVLLAWRRAPALAFALLWVPVTLLPVSNVLFPSGVLLAERNMYLPTVGVVLAAGMWIDWGATRYGETATIAAVALLGLLAAGRVWTRNPVWHDSKRFAVTLLADHPESYWAHWFAGQVYAGASDWPRASHELSIARRLFARDPQLLRESAEIALEQRDFRSAAMLLDSAAALRPADPAPLLRLADVRYRMGDPRGAIAAAQRALTMAPDSTRAGIVIGEAARQLADTGLALRTYRELVTTHPTAWELRVGYADVLLATGDTAAARDQATRAVELSHGAGAALSVRDRIRATHSTGL